MENYIGIYNIINNEILKIAFSSQEQYLIYPFINAIINMEDKTAGLFSHGKRLASSISKIYFHYYWNNNFSNSSLWHSRPISLT